MAGQATIATSSTRPVCAAGLGRPLARAGLPVDRLTLHLRGHAPGDPRTQRRLGARREQSRLRDRRYETRDDARAVREARCVQVMETGRPLALRTEGHAGARPGYGTDALRRARPRSISSSCRCATADGLVNAATFSTDCARSGFIAAAHRHFWTVSRRRCEMSANSARSRTRRNAPCSTPMSVPATARRVMAGQVRRGEVEMLEAGLLICDLRGFTSIVQRAARRAGARIAERLFRPRRACDRPRPAAR